MGILEHLLAPDVRPFAIAAVMIVFVGGVEVISMLIGFSISESIGSAFNFDGHFNGHGDHGLLNAISWINAGGVPLLIFVLLVLGMFSIAGFLIQDIARALGGPLPTIVAAPAALVVALPFVRASSRLVAKIIPRDESYAVDLGDLVGRVGEVVIGPLDQGLPGRVRVKDIYGNLHFVAASAAPASPPLPQGASVLLVDRDDTRFVAVAVPDDLKSPAKSPASSRSISQSH
ncbi:OB-fold-containig protein [Bradyrhizobium prioriisuperbiae]|uniref:OB-fold-containig protein n=1 Tax=Bradyrhizobium prioriisuperbiae TaxID=2854389 RepID=UPI0028E2DFBC|nr:OB-fold-containig protein [Bradyrhizobium prioritasuperba]